MSAAEMGEARAEEPLLELPHLGPLVPLGLQELREQAAEEELAPLEELEEERGSHYFLFPALEWQLPQSKAGESAKATTWGPHYEEEIFISGKR